MSYEPTYDAPPPAATGPSESARYPDADAPRGGYSDSGRDRDVREPSRGHYDGPKEEPRDYPPPPRGDRGDRGDRDGGRGYNSGPRDGGRGGYEGGGGRSNGGPRGPTVKPEPSNCLGVFGLSLRTREADLDQEFKQYGTVESVTIVYDQKTGRSRCFGFIQMATTEEATLCIEKLNGIDLHGRNMRVDYSTTQRPHDPTPGAYMGHKRPERSDGYGGGYSGGGGSGYSGGRDGYSRGGYDDRRPRYNDYDRYDRRGGDDYDRRGGRDDRYDDYYRYDSSYYDRRDRDRYDRRERSPPRRREYYDSDAQRAPRRYSASPDPRDDRKDRDRDPRAGSRAAYDDVPPPADARY